MKRFEKCPALSAHWPKIHFLLGKNFLASNSLSKSFTMNLRSFFLLLSALFLFQLSFGQTNFIIQETNVKKNLTQCITLAKKTANVLLKKQTVYTIPISSKSTLTAVAITRLSEKFMTVFPKENT